MGYYLFNTPGDASGAARKRAAECLRVGMWAVGAEEAHGHALRRGDLTLVYVGAPERLLIGRAEIASEVHVWAPSEAQAYPGDSGRGVLLTDVTEWDPPVPMESVLRRIDQSAGARADFDTGIVGITRGEYETALQVAGP